MRVTHVVRSDGWAGVERHVTTLASAQHRAGHEVTVIGGHPEQARTAVPDDVRHVPATTVLDVVRALQRRDVRSRSDVLHVHMSAAELAAAIAPGTSGLPVVTTRHFGRRRGGSPASRGLLALAARRIDASIAISEYVAGHVEGDPVVIYPGVACTTTDAPAAAREDVLLLAQRLEPEKATDVGIRAFAESGLAARGWRLDVAGDGSERPTLQRLVDALGLHDCVRFLGHRTDVPRLMATAAVFIAPTPAEGLGLSVLEAMAARLPVVASGSGGHVETCGRVDPGTLFRPGDVVGAAVLLHDLATDPARRDALGAQLQSAQRSRFTPEAQASATDDVYRSVL